jgi:dihydroorotase
MGMIGDEVGELEDPRFINRDLALRVGAAPEIVGLKARMDRVGGLSCLEPLAAAVEVAEALGKCVMVHIGRGARMHASLGEILALLRPGDIITHTYHGFEGGITDGEGQLLLAVREARTRGVLFDVGHGGGSFAFRVAEGALAQGFPPDVISSDLHTGSINGPAYDLPTTMTKFLHLGLSLQDVIARVTMAPAQVLGMAGEIGTLAPGAQGDVTLLSLEAGKFPLRDCVRETRLASQALIPRGVIVGGQPVGMGPRVA